MKQLKNTLQSGPHQQLRIVYTLQLILREVTRGVVANTVGFTFVSYASFCYKIIVIRFLQNTAFPEGHEVAIKGPPHLGGDA